MYIEDDFLVPILWTLVGIVVGSLTGAAMVGLVCARRGRRQLGCASLMMSWVVVVSLGVVALVLWRAKNGEATSYDWLWALGLGALGWTTARALWSPRPRTPRQTIP